MASSAEPGTSWLGGSWAEEAGPQAAPPSGPADRGRLRRLARFYPEYGVLAALAAFCILFGVLSPAFFTQSVWGNITVTAAFSGIPAIGVVMLMIAGEFDLSVGATFQLAPMFMVVSITDWGWGIAAAFIAGIALVLVVGLVNAAVTTRLRLPSFVATLGMAMFLQGIEYVATGGSPVSLPVSDTLTQVLGGSIAGSSYFVPTLWFLGLGLVAAFMLSVTRMGNWIFAAGGNTDAARAVGVPVIRVKSTMFIASAFLSGLAGIMQLAYLQQWQPTDTGTLALTSIVVAVLGGASLFGGVGSVIGSIIAAVLVGSLSIGLVLIGAPGDWYTSVIGAVLIVAVVINQNFRAAIGRLRRRVS